MLLDVYNKQIRSPLEYAAPAWGNSLTKQNKKDLERVQKCAFAIIFGSQSYRKTLKNYKIKSLDDRRSASCLKFALKTSKNVKFQNWFKKSDAKVRTTRQKIPKFTVVPSRTKRFRKSPIPVMTDLLNDNEI